MWLVCGYKGKVELGATNIYLNGTSLISVSCYLTLWDLPIGKCPIVMPLVQLLHTLPINFPFLKDSLCNILSGTFFVIKSTFFNSLSYHEVYNTSGFLVVVSVIIIFILCFIIMVFIMFANSYYTRIIWWYNKNGNFALQVSWRVLFSLWTFHVDITALNTIAYAHCVHLEKQTHWLPLLWKINNSVLLLLVTVLRKCILGTLCTVSTNCDQMY